ncbi:MAG: TonB-dependent receptor [candidate division Zixibacteria bacterium]|nr:TonB-dependent receptor [candidate division Zixibacteria bacterium]
MRKLLLNLLILLILLFSYINASTFRGRVVDKDNMAIEGVNIQTDIPALYTTTDKNGEFILETGDAMPSYITFGHVSFLPKMQTISENSSTQINMVLKRAIYPGQNIKVTAERAEMRLSPISYSDFSKNDIERDYMISELPLLLETTPNLYSYADAGGGLGYSYIKIRGFDDKRIAVYINGVPLNDPEDHATYFVDIPDFAADVSDIQVQRGVGNSLYGDASFGGSINITSSGLERPRKISIATGYGQFSSNHNFVSEMRKQSVEYSSGLIDGRWSFAGRYSKMYSGGYRENSWSDSRAYYFSLSRLDENMTTTINIYGGPMKMHLAYYGVDRGTMSINRRSNSAYGLDYENATDNFDQPHYELHNTFSISEGLQFKNTLYYIRGKGYYEQFKDERDVDEYNIQPENLADPSLTEVDLVRQKWVTKNQYGWNPRFDWNYDKGKATFGLSYYHFNSEHWGQVVWAENLLGNINPRNRYYEYFGKKNFVSMYALNYYNLSDKIRLMSNIQLKYLRYDFNRNALGAYSSESFDLDWLFLSPRIGLTYLLNDKTDLFFSFAISSREPADQTIFEADEPDTAPSIINGKLTADSERVYDFELGGNWNNDNAKLGLNLFWMEFVDEIIPQGGLDDNGRAILGNADRSIHAGIELDGTYKINKYLSISGNGSFNYNRIKKYFIYNDTDWDGTVDDTTDFSDNPVAGFPNYLANLIIDWNKSPLHLTYRLRAVDKQYIENGGIDDLAIDPYLLSSISFSVPLGKIGDNGFLTLSARMNNIFNEIYEQSGYAYEWGGTWYGEYFPGAEANYFMQLKLDFE